MKMIYMGRKKQSVELLKWTLEQGIEVGCLTGGGQHGGSTALQLGDLGGHRSELEGAFVGAAPQNHICQFCGGGLGEPGDQNGLDAPGLCHFQHLQR